MRLAELLLTRGADVEDHLPARVSTIGRSRPQFGRRGMKPREGQAPDSSCNNRFSTRHFREKLVAVVTAECQLGAIDQKNDMVAMEQGLYLANCALANYNGAACSNELLRAEFVYDALDCLA
jgi:hypothetical protein